MASYQPPFAITNHMVKLVSEIAEKIGRLDRYQSLDAKPCLRRNNRIRSIHSSLAIEANSLSIDAVRGVIDGKTVIGPVKEIQEVKNAYRAYDELGKFDPFSIDELKRLHGVMTYLTVDESGQFRRGEEGVFDGGRCIFMAPPAMRVSALMDDLFSWMKQARKDVHPLILSSVFHYEFVFIHPFADGNGRMSRLLTTLLLYRNGFYVGKYISLEAKIAKNKDLYYDALAQAQTGWHEGTEDVVPFIKYLLGTILAAYKDFEDRVALVETKLPALEMVRRASKNRIGRFNKQDIRELCPTLSDSSIEGALRKLVAADELKKEGRGKNTCYFRLN